MRQSIMNKKGIYFLLLLAVSLMVLTLMPAQVTRADELVCPVCGDPLVPKYNDNYYHRYFCSNTECENYQVYLDDASYEEDHSLDENCYCSICNAICHDDVYCWDGVHISPTCTEPGYEYSGVCYHCKRCGLYHDGADQPVGTVIPALGHDWETGWTYDDDVHYHACTRCTARSDETAHSFGEWEDTGDGINHKRTCSCGKEETEAHDWQTAYHYMYHWQECSSCHVKKEEVSHVLKQEVQ